MKYTLSTILILLCLLGFANTYTVTNTNDSGTGSLRSALDMAIFVSGTHTIEFNIPNTDPNYNSTTGVWTIYLSSTLSYITSDNITIDGFTQTANQGDTNPLGPEIELDGNDNAIDYAFSIINSSNIHIKGLCIKDFTIGIQMFGNSSTNNTITGNYIGINATSSDTVGNYIGVEIIGGPSNNIVGGTNTIDRNIVSGNEHIGIRIVDASYNTVIGNYVGLDRTGTFAMGNYDGVSIEGAATYNIVGGNTLAERNVIAGNYAYGVPVFGAGCNYNKIIGNYIGVDVTGNNALPNTYGVLFDDGAAFNLIGGDLPEDRNILSGNSGYGVFIYNMGTHDNVVKGNFIGTDPTGTFAIPNANGIVIDGAAYNSLIDSNLISGNLQQGIAIHITSCNGNILRKNLIGTDISGTTNIGNGIDGVRIAEGPQSNIIGGSSNERNIIAYNGGNGVTVMNNGDDYNLISCNSIFNNAGLGIDLYLPGVNQNDAGDTDSGPNEEMNYPVIDTVIYNGMISETQISGTLDTQNPETCTIEIFLAIPDPSGYGEGMMYLGTSTPDASGNWNYTVIGINEGDFITTTATDANFNTSEFSLCASSLYPVGIAEVDHKYIVYPNPTSTKVFVEVNNEKLMINDIAVYDIYGKKVFSVEVENLNKEVDLSFLPKGIYLLKISDKNNVSFEKIVLQ